MSWDKIENHLFEKYCVEGEDKELCKLIEEHDKEIRDKVIDELMDKICSHFADWQYTEDDKWIKDIIGLASESAEEIAEQMKGVQQMNDNQRGMTPPEAWHIISGCMNELANIRNAICGKGYSEEEVEAEVICFEALRRMEEEDR